MNRNIHAMTGSKNLPFIHWNNWSSAALFLLLSCSMLIKPSNYLAPLIVLIASALTWRTWRNDTQRLPRAFRWFLWATCLLAASWLIDNLFSSAHWRNFTLDKPLRPAGEVAAAFHAQLSGTLDPRAGEIATFDICGSSDALVSALLAEDLARDVEVTRASLDRVFLELTDDTNERSLP